MGKNSLNNFMCHLSWLKKLSPAHTHPLKTIHEFSRTYELLFSELESLIKCNHKIRVQECYGGRAMSCPWHGGWRHMGAPFGRHAALWLFHLSGGYFSKYIYLAVLSTWLNLEPLYLAQLCTYTGATYGEEIIYLLIIFLELWIFKNFHILHFFGSLANILKILSL